MRGVITANSMCFLPKAKIKAVKDHYATDTTEIKGSDDVFTIGI